MSKRNKIIYWVATLWLSLGMVATGVAQLLKQNGQGGADSMARLGYPAYLMMLLGICKISGVVALLIPRYPLLKEWAYAGFAFLMIGAMFSHIAAGEPLTATLPALFLLALTAVSWYFRPAERKLVLA